MFTLLRVICIVVDLLTIVLTKVYQNKDTHDMYMKFWVSTDYNRELHRGEHDGHVWYTHSTCADAFGHAQLYNIYVHLINLMLNLFCAFHLHESFTFLVLGFDSVLSNVNWSFSRLQTCFYYNFVNCFEKLGSSQWITIPPN